MAPFYRSYTTSYRSVVVNIHCSYLVPFSSYLTMKKYLERRRVTLVHGHSRSSKLVPVESPCGISCESWIIVWCDLILFLSYCDLLVKKSAFSPFLLQSRLKPSVGVFPWNLGFENRSRQIDVSALTCRQKHHDRTVINFDSIPSQVK